jgi:hypothetical protein
MENDKELSNLKLDRRECAKCGATWINGKHVFRGTGNSYSDSEMDLAGLVCNNLGDGTCINPKKGIVGGQTWEYRAGYIDGAMKTKRDMIEELGNLDKG